MSTRGAMIDTLPRKEWHLPALTCFPLPGSVRMPRACHQPILHRPSFTISWLRPIRSTSYPMAGDRRQGRLRQPDPLRRRRARLLQAIRCQRLSRPLEAQLSRQDPPAGGRLRHRPADQIVDQPVRPDLLADHRRILTPQHIQLHHSLDRSEVQLRFPATVPPLSHLVSASAPASAAGGRGRWVQGQPYLGVVNSGGYGSSGHER